MNQKNIGFIGFGLIGGSIARVLKKNCPACRIYVYNARHPQIKPGLLLAKKEGTIDSIESTLEENFGKCDIIFLCAPVLSNIEYLQKLKPLIKNDCIITDVGSVKGNIHEAVLKLDMEENFIGGHPMAGSEKTGYENSTLTLLENAYYLLTPTKKAPQKSIDTMTELAKLAGAIPVVLDAKEHDDITAAISHVPHIIASSLVNMVREQDDSQERMHAFAAGGFRDITRIASSSPVMWENICITNKDSICKFLDIFTNSLMQFKETLLKEDTAAILNFFDEAKEYRNSIPNKSVGPISRQYEIYLDVDDKPGSIAIVATLLAFGQISIKNIGILHNREFENGVLRIEFYDEASMLQAMEILKSKNYSIIR